MRGASGKPAAAGPRASASATPCAEQREEGASLQSGGPGRAPSCGRDGQLNPWPCWPFSSPLIRPRRPRPRRPRPPRRRPLTSRRRRTAPASRPSSSFRASSCASRLRSLNASTSLHVTTAEIDIAFLNRVLLRYQGPLVTVSGADRPDHRIRRRRAPRDRAARLEPALRRRRHRGRGVRHRQPARARRRKAAARLRAPPPRSSPVRWWLPYLIVQEQVSVAGDGGAPRRQHAGRPARQHRLRPGVLLVQARSRRRHRLRRRRAGRLFGQLEVGSLLVGRAGLFMRAGTQLLGTRQIDYSMEVGVRYLFRLSEGRQVK